jgi:hypothetical protein
MMAQRALAVQRWKELTTIDTARLQVDANDLRRRANQYRAMAARIDDARAVRALQELADEYEALAEKIASQPDANPNEGIS